MILNQRQLQISRKKLADLIIYRDAVVQRRSPASQLEQESIDEVLTDLEHEISEYESLFNSHPSQIEINSLNDLPLAIIKARIASGLTHQKLASRLQLTESAIQRYEQQSYRGVSFERLREIIDAIGIPMLVRHDPLKDAKVYPYLEREH
jgi:ribosome-binding protein aMBF1 (putative translation factor)